MEHVERYIHMIKIQERDGERFLSQIQQEERDDCLHSTTLQDLKFKLANIMGGGIVLTSRVHVLHSLFTREAYCIKILYI